MRKNIILLIGTLLIILLLSISSSSFAATIHTQEEAVNWICNHADNHDALDWPNSGYGVQCVDLTCYYYDYLGNSISWGNGYDYKTNTLPDGWERIERYQGMIPEPGDVVVWDSYQGIAGKPGHVAIVVSANSDSMYVVNQASGVPCQYDTYSNSNYWGVIRPDFRNIPRANILSGVYVIHSAWDDNMCLDITGDSMDNNANIQLYQRVTTNNVQKFRIIKWNSDYYCIQSMHNGLWLDVASPFTDNSNVKLYYDNSADENHWYFEDAGDGYVYIKNKRGSYLDVYADSAVNRRNIQTYHYVGNNSQRWRLEDVTEYYNLHSDTYRIVSAINEEYRFDIASNSTEVDANIQLFHREDSNVQHFKFIKNGKYYFIQSVYSGLWFDIKTPITNNSNVKLYGNHDSPENQWVLEDAGDGYVYIRSNADFYLDVQGDKAEDHANIQVYRFVGNNSQKWRITEYDFRITYDANGGSGAPEPEWKQYNVGRIMTDEIPEKEGYLFGGWKTVVNGEELFFMPNGVYWNDADTTMVAQWIELMELKLPDQTTSIESEAFTGVKASRIIVPSNVTHIGEKAFANNNNLCEVFIYSDSATFDSDVFLNCPRLIIHGYPQSTAYTYASLNRIPFVPITD